MRSAFVSQIFISPVETVLVLALCAYIVWTGRSYLAVGIYLSMTLWTRIVFVGPVVHTYVLLGTMYAAALVDLYRQKKIPVLPPRYRGIVLWMVLWWTWILLLILLFQPTDQRSILRSLILYLMAPLPIILTFGHDLRRIKGFTLAYVATTLVGGWQALQMLNIPLSYLPGDPALTQRGVVTLGIPNYHWVGYMFAIALILTITLYLSSRRNMLKLVLLIATATCCAYFLLLAGSRQSVNGAVAVSLLLLAWAILRKGVPKLRVMLLAGIVGFVSISLYLTAPQLIVRENETGLFDAINILSDRGNLWRIGWENYLSSPIWGTGFKYTKFSHNIFISTLADQGIVGIVFFAGFLLFMIWQTRGIFTNNGPGEYAIWRIGFLGIVLFGLIHGQASGTVFSTWHLFWATAFLWWLSWQSEQASESTLPVATDELQGRRSIGVWQQREHSLWQQSQRRDVSPTL
ncbi:MAG: O-antigen ligase family protein [Chloroflexales bacterium]|nr:O-antigen ligase family protein [Chloroflexales bacterium]